MAGMRLPCKLLRCRADRADCQENYRVAIPKHEELKVNYANFTDFPVVAGETLMSGIRIDYSGSGIDGASDFRTCCWSILPYNEAVLSSVGIVRRQFGAVRAGADAGHKVFDDEVRLRLLEF